MKTLYRIEVKDTYQERLQILKDGKWSYFGSKYKGLPRIWLRDQGGSFVGVEGNCRDNDIAYESGWLDALETTVTKHNADVVAPLICIGPPVASTIHHAARTLVTENKNGCLQLKEVHRLMNKPIAILTEANAPLENHVTEFHCFLTRSDCVRDMGGLDERLITREQMDFALRARLLDRKVVFEKDAVVTYMAKDRFEKNHLSYHLFRWSHELAVQSVDAFCESWGSSSIGGVCWIHGSGGIVCVRLKPRIQC